MKETSRRSFGKQIAGALALPVASLAMKSVADGQSRKRPQQIERRSRGYFNQHDTPPPLTINDGSFEIEATDQLRETGSGPWSYTSDFGGKTKIHSIRVIHGSGVMVYQNLNAEGSIITLDLVKYSTTPLSTLKISCDQNGVRIMSSLKLTQPPEKNKGRRRWRRVHPNANDYGFRIQRITIESPSGKFSVSHDSDSIVSEEDFSHEYRILVWVE